MRTTPIILLATALCAIVAAGCGGENEPVRAERGDPGIMMRHDHDMHAMLAQECPRSSLRTVEPDRLTIAVVEGLEPPWLEGDPAAGEGFEGAVAAETAVQLTFESDEVTWTRVSAADVFEPGPKDYDFAIGQLAWSAERDEVADFTRAYYEINQAVVALDSSSVADAETLADLADADLGAVAGSESTLARVAAPNGERATFESLDDAAAALGAGEAEGVVADLPTAFRLAEAVEDARIVGQLPATDPLAYFALVTEEGSPLVECLDLVVEHLGVMTDWLATEQAWWLSERARIPFFE
jgi:polar amino acid transport system substrate-binding protein